MMILFVIPVINITVKNVHTHLHYIINMRVQDVIAVLIKEDENL